MKTEKEFGIYSKGLNRIELMIHLLEMKLAYSNKPLFEHTFSCGNKVTYNSVVEIPGVSMPCKCGNKNHWFIYYDEKKNGGCYPDE